MSGDWPEVWEVFHEALELPEGERAALLDACCADAAMRERVERMLSANARQSGFLDTPPIELCAPLAVDREQERIAGYEIVRVIGEGGMGVVYEAVQHAPVHRRVALKVIRAGLASERIVARFASEGQTLARMTHPCVAQVYDAGTTERGRPYFAMEFVDGVPITAYCKEHGLGLRERLRLFLRVCEGVQHAHQKGVIHRDLKPANILVCDASTGLEGSDRGGTGEGGPLPKVLDFGVAKLVESDAMEGATLGATMSPSMTRAGEIVGTPTHMSPEQIKGEDVDTRSDAYSLGVLLYQLLCGSLPFEGGEGFSLIDLQRLICESEPTRPSARLAGGAGPVTSRQVRGDLDWIVLRAMEKERGRRYESVSGLAADVARHLAHEPVVAGPPSALYRLGKLARRNRAAFAAGVIVLVSLSGAVIGTSIALARAHDAERVAREEAELATAINRFIDQTLASADPAYGPDLTMRSVLDSAALRMDRALGASPRVQGALRRTIGRSYQRLGLYERAVEQFERAHAGLLEGGASLGEQADCLVQLAGVLVLLGRYPRALETLDRVDELVGRRGVPAAAGARAMLVRADVLAEMGEVDEAQALFERSAVDLRETMEPDDPELATLLSEYAIFLRTRLQHDRAQEVYDEILAIQRRTMDEEHPEVLTMRNNIAMLLLYRGDYAGSRPLLAEVLKARRRALPAGHPDIAESANNLAIALEKLGEIDRAIELYDEASEILAGAFGEIHPNIATLMFNVGSIHLDHERYEPAEERFVESLRIDRALRGDTHPYIADALFKLGTIAFACEDYALALERYEECARIRGAVLPAESEKTPSARAAVGATLVRLGRVEEGHERLLEAFETLRELEGLGDGDTQFALTHLIEAVERLGETERASAYRDLLEG